MHVKKGARIGLRAKEKVKAGLRKLARRAMARDRDFYAHGKDYR